MVKQRVVFLMTVLTVFSLSSQEDFSHVNRYYREEFGDEVTVRSVGTTRGLVELDDKNVVKEGICNNTRLQHPQQNLKTLNAKTQSRQAQKETHKGQGTSTQPRNIKHKGLHINQRNQWATGADLGRPSATAIAEGVVILD
ncbi:hypothetical protein FSP39_011959 [Pinctada imbricata]|uniref:Uncharacterized protein n=1 Tax=Pinctada imbricata TaxID=66713 RepID=A0AA88Y6A0_PINIB|nr:hypothetical protein FSP39_011959 [Pinctada imbricata]